MASESLLFEIEHSRVLEQFCNVSLYMEYFCWKLLWKSVGLRVGRTHGDNFIGIAPILLFFPKHEPLLVQEYFFWDKEHLN
jgi:hypothetical protein